jgi:hypothetical protein
MEPAGWTELERSRRRSRVGHFAGFAERLGCHAVRPGILFWVSRGGQAGGKSRRSGKSSSLHCSGRRGVCVVIAGRGAGKGVGLIASTERDGPPAGGMCTSCRISL